MQPGLLPLFPLPLVLFPRTPLPLHIFEDRYKQMMAEVMPERREFGVTLVHEQGMSRIGCTAVVEKVVERYADGRLDLLAEGRRRFEILDVNQEAEYLRASVEFFDDEDAEGAPAALRRQALDTYQGLRALDASLAEPAPGDPQLSFLLAQGVEDLEFRLKMLNTRSEPERLRTLIEFCRTYIPKQRLTAALKRVQPRNGHCKVRRFSDSA
jgi:Lon protease-like protein